MYRLITTAFAVITAALIFITPPVGANQTDIIATLDGAPITRADVERYVNTVLSESYRAQLETEKGLRTLTDHYIDRTLLLEMARNTIKKDDPMLKTHAGESIGTERAYLSALIKKKINDQLRLEPSEVDAYMKKHGIEDRTKAEYRMLPEARAKLLQKLIASARSGHEITYY